MTFLDALTSNYGADVSRAKGGASFRAVGVDGVIMRSGDQPTGMTIPGLLADDWRPCGNNRSTGPTLASLFSEMLPPVLVDCRSLSM